MDERVNYRKEIKRKCDYLRYITSTRAETIIYTNTATCDTMSLLRYFCEINDTFCHKHTDIYTNTKNNLLLTNFHSLSTNIFF